MKWHDFLFIDANDSFKIENLTNIFIHESQKRIEFRMINKDYRYIIIAIDRKFIRSNEINVKKNNDDNDDDDDSYDQMTIHNMKMINKIYTRLEDLIRILSSESIDIFRDIFNHWQWYYKLVSRSELDEKDDIIEEEIKILTNDKKIKKIIRKIYETLFKWKNEK